MLAPTRLFGHGERLDKHLLVGHYVLIGLLLALLPHLRVLHAEGNGVLEGFFEHVSVNLAALIHPPNIISNAVNGLELVPHVLYFLALGHYGDLAE